MENKTELQSLIERIKKLRIKVCGTVKTDSILLGSKIKQTAP